MGTRHRPAWAKRTAVEQLESRVLMAVAGMEIPQAHPRIWWTADRLDRARTWYQANPFTPSTNDAWGNALRYQLTGETTYARAAITRMMAFRVPDNDLGGTKSDTYRWEDWVPVVYDWCYDQMTPAERTEFTDRYNGYATTMMGKLFGGPTMPGNNYFWGYLRNEVNWGIASYYENPQADTFLQDALVTRWQNAFVPYAASDAQGGSSPEGSQYGRYILEYPVVPFTSAGLLGRDILDETNFYREALYALIYATSNGPVANEAGTSSFPQIFPYSDDFDSEGYPPAADQYYGDFVTAMATHFDGTALEAYARRWLANTDSPVSRYVEAVDDGGTAAPSFAALPLDYFAPGMQYLYARRSWNTGATSMLLQLGEPDGVGHGHFDTGSFQLISGGRWLTKETSGYNGDVVGWGGTGTAFIGSTTPHNGLLFNGQGLVAREYHDAPPDVTRLETQPAYTFASVDLSGAYRAHVRPQVDNPYASKAVRDFIYVRELDALVVLDRMDSTSADVAKTFLLHFPTAPTLSGNTALGVNGNMALKLTSLTPGGQNAPVMRVVDERPASQDNSIDYQWRVEADTSGSTQSYLLNVMQARGVSDPDLTITLTEDAGSFTLTLTHPTRGTAVIRLNKGMVSSGGSFGFTPTPGGTPSEAQTTPLADTVQQVSVGDTGPVWGAAGGGGTPTVSFALSSFGGVEGVNTATITVTRAGDPSVPFSVNYATSDGTATSGSDYTAATGTLNFAAGQMTRTFTIPVANDTAVESAETVNLTLSAPTGGVNLGTRSTAALVIDDNDGSNGGGGSAPAAPGGLAATAAVGQVSLSWTDASANESGFRVERRRTGGSWSQIASVGAGVQAYTDAAVAAGTVYEYRVRAYNGSGNSAYSNTASATTPASGGGTPDTVPPTATGTFGPVTDGASYTFTVVYTDNGPLNLTSFDGGDVVVTGPGAFSQAASVVSVQGAGGTSRRVTYRITAPGGAWDDVDSGQYTASLQADQVLDAAGNAAAAAQLGTFDVDVPEGRTLLGSFGVLSATSRKAAVLRFNDADGTAVTMGLKGGGMGQAFLEDGQIVIDLTGTTAKSALAIGGKLGDGRVELGNVFSSGPLKGVKAATTDLVGTLFVNGPAGLITLGGVAGGTVAVAGDLLGVVVKGALSDATVLSGVNLGADGVLGGGDDSAGAGSIRTVKVAGSTTGSVFAAGALPGANGVFGDGDDVHPAGATNMIRSFMTMGDVDATSRVMAGVFGAVRIARGVVDPATDPRFVLLT